MKRIFKIVFLFGQVDDDRPPPGRDVAMDKYVGIIRLRKKKNSQKKKKKLIETLIL